MSDRILYDNLKLFLVIDAKEEIARLSKIIPKELADKKIEEFKKDNARLLRSLQSYNGFCFGLAVCYGAMGIAGKLEKWKQGLVAIANWKGSVYQLDQPLIEPETKDAETKTLPSSKVRPRTLRTVFEEFLNVVPFNHTGFYHDEIGINQDNLLNPMGIKREDETPKSPFEISLPVAKSDGKIEFQVKTIKQRATIAGKFDDDQLAKILDEKTIANTICVVSLEIVNLRHACHVSYDPKTNLWTVYNTHYDQGSLKDMQFTGTKMDVIKELRSQLGDSMRFQVATVDPERRLQLPKLSDLITSSSTCVQDYGLFTLFKTPEHLKELFLLAKDNQKLREDLTAALTMTDREFWADWDERQQSPSKYPDFSFAMRYKLRDKDNLVTALHEMALNHPHAFEQLIDLAVTVKDKHLATVIFEQLSACEGMGVSLFRYIVNYAPDSLPKLFKLGELLLDYSEMEKFLCKALTRSIGRETELEYLVSRRPQTILYLADIAEKSTALRDMLVKLSISSFSKLLRSYSSGMMERLVSQDNYFFLQLVEKNPKKPEYLLLATYLTNDPVCGQELKDRLIKVCEDKSFAQHAAKNEIVKKFMQLMLPVVHHEESKQEVPRSKEVSAPIPESVAAPPEKKGNNGMWNFFYSVGAGIVNTCRIHKGQEKDQSAKIKKR